MLGMGNNPGSVELPGTYMDQYMECPVLTVTPCLSASIPFLTKSARMKSVPANFYIS